MNVEFDDSQSSYNNFPNMNTGPKGMVGWLTKKGWVKSENEAKIYLVVVAVIFLVISLLIFSKLGLDATSNDLPAEDPLVQTP